MLFMFDQRKLAMNEKLLKLPAGFCVVFPQKNNRQRSNAIYWRLSLTICGPSASLELVFKFKPPPIFIKSFRLSDPQGPTLAKKFPKHWITLYKFMGVGLQIWIYKSSACIQNRYGISAWTADMFVPPLNAQTNTLKTVRKSCCRWIWCEWGVKRLLQTENPDHAELNFGLTTCSMHPESQMERNETKRSDLSR